MGKKGRITVLLLALVVFCSSHVWAAQTAGDLPKRISLGTSQAGGLWFAIGSSIGKVISEHSKISAEVKPFGGSTTYYPLVNSGELDLGLNNAIDLNLAYLGPDKFKIAGRNPFIKSTNLRLIMSGAPIKVAMWVKKSSDIQSAKDLKGRKVTGEYPAQLGIWFWSFGYLQTCGLKWEDVKVVPVPDFSKGIEALVDGRAESCLSAPGIAMLKEANAAVGIRMISVCHDEEAIKRLQGVIPGYYPTLIKAGAYPEIDKDGWGLASDIYLYANSRMSDATVKEILRCLWDFNSELAPVHAFMKDWTNDRAVDRTPTIPYHPGAIQFYKEKGVWTKEVEEIQVQLLKQ
jgi:uncharacterized protein